MGSFIFIVLTKWQDENRWFGEAAKKLRNVAGLLLYRKVSQFCYKKSYK